MYMFDVAGPKWHHWVCSALLNNRRSNVTFYNSLGKQVNTLLLLVSMRRTDKGSYSAMLFINENMHNMYHLLKLQGL